METPASAIDASGGKITEASPVPASVSGPHVFLALQTPDAQTRAPTACVHTERLAGELGSGPPFGTSDRQVPVPPSWASQ